MLKVNLCIKVVALIKITTVFHVSIIEVLLLVLLLFTLLLLVPDESFLIFSSFFFLPSSFDFAALEVGTTSDL